MTLHYAIEAALSEAGRAMTTAELAERVNTSGLYKKRDGSPVTPFQVHGRTRKYPRLFSKAGSTISLARWGDSANQATIDEPSRTVPASAVRSTTPSPAVASDVETSLLNDEAFRPAGSIDPEVPDRPGLYAIKVRDRAALPQPFGNLLDSRDSDLIYVGIAGTSLRKRFLGQELRARGHGTFFRSIGAVLGFRPPSGSLVGMANGRNYTFAAQDNGAIINWINANLIVNWIEFAGAHAVEESSLLRAHTPLLNLQGNPAALPQLKALRAECVRIASAGANTG
ncbi:GIY-YIG nuclease family protein [Microbacterium sp. SY138]|uniref:GIY-YIG nuclease family protein n=1 Tax=Microbacterium sp. SY138 TaxID=3149040 RepID=UPI00321AA437